MTRYRIRIPGDGFVYIDDLYKIRKDSFKQLIDDVDKSNKLRYYQYGNKND
jgi:hypothetical protein